MSAHGTEVVHGVVVASERHGLDVVYLCGLTWAAQDGAFVSVAIEDSLPDALPSGVVAMGTWHLPPPPAFANCIYKVLAPLATPYAFGQVIGCSPVQAVVLDRACSADLDALDEAAVKVEPVKVGTVGAGCVKHP